MSGKTESEPYFRPYQLFLRESIELARVESKRYGTSRGILLAGGSGSGKTFAFDQVFSSYPVSTSGVQRISPVARASVGKVGNVAKVIDDLSISLGCRNHEVSETKKMAFLFDQIQSCQTHTILIEEAHNGLLAGGAIGKNFGIFLKNLWNFHLPSSAKNWASGEGIPYTLVIAISALPKIISAIGADDELDTRYNSIILATSLRPFPKEMLGEYRDCLRAILLRNDAWTPEAEKFDFGMRMYFATSGHMRRMNDYAVRSVSLRQKMGPVDLNSLYARVFEVLGGSRTQGLLGNPFTWSNTELARQAELLTTRIEKGP